MTQASQTPLADATVDLAGRDTLVAGGTGNVGTFLVDGFIRAGARVIVPSRSQAKLDRLLNRLGEEKARSVVGIVGDIGKPDGAEKIQRHVADVTGRLFAVASSCISYHQTASMIQAGFEDFKYVIETGLYAQYLAAQTFLPLLENGGAYTTINGPVGFLGPPPPGIGSLAVVSIAQNKLTQALAVEIGGQPRVNDVIMQAFLGPQGTRPGSPLTGEQVGDFIAALSTPLADGVNAQTVHLRDPRQVTAALAGDFTDPG